jgi:hypothetical protein
LTFASTESPNKVEDEASPFRQRDNDIRVMIDFEPLMRVPMASAIGAAIAQLTSG